MRDFWLRVFLDTEEDQEHYKEVYYRAEAPDISKATFSLLPVLDKHIAAGEEIAYFELSDISQEAADFLN